MPSQTTHWSTAPGELNARMAAEHLGYSVIQTQVVRMYERIAAQIRAKKESKSS